MKKVTHQYITSMETSRVADIPSTVILANFGRCNMSTAQQKDEKSQQQDKIMSILLPSESFVKLYDFIDKFCTLLRTR